MITNQMTDEERKEFLDGAEWRSDSEKRPMTQEEKSVAVEILKNTSFMRESDTIAQGIMISFWMSVYTYDANRKYQTPLLGTLHVKDGKGSMTQLVRVEVPDY